MYKSAFIVKRYTVLGGKYSGSVTKSTGINRWLKAEEWIQVLPYLDGKIIQCGSSKGEMIACRPSKRANSKTPITIQEVIKNMEKLKFVSWLNIKSDIQQVGLIGLKV